LKKNQTIKTKKHGKKRGGKKIKEKRERKDKREKEKKLREPPPAPVCKFYLGGACTKGNECIYQHIGTPIKKLEVCKFFKVGVCRKGDECVYSHDLKNELCQFFYKGTCTLGNECKYSHDDQMLAAARAKEAEQATTENQLTEKENNL